MKPLNPKKANTARRRIRRVASHLRQARQQLEAAQSAAPTSYSRQRLQQLAVDLRSVSEPFSFMASASRAEVTDERILARSPRNTPPAVLPIDRNRKRPKQVSQADVLIGMLRDARAMRIPLELPEIMRAGIAQHGARFNEIRAQGFEIRNRMERTTEGVVRSCYWLTFDPEVDAR